MRKTENTLSSDGKKKGKREQLDEPTECQRVRRREKLTTSNVEK
jgi:hypothetical protein